MKAYELKSPWGVSSWHLIDKPDPKPGAGQILIRVRAVSLNFRDLMIAKASYGNPKENRIPLSDGAGEVVALGEGVTAWKVGDRVAGLFFQSWLAGGISESDHKSAMGGSIDGMLSELVVLSQEGVVRIPAHLSFEEAATLPCAALTAWQALVTLGHLAPGESVLVQGTGGVSIFALQFGRLAGARVIVTSSSDRKLERARELGASETINYKTTPDWDEAAKKLTGGRGVDHVVEVGGPGTLERSFNAVRAGGRVSLIGILAGAAGEVSPLAVLRKSITFQGIYVGSREMFMAMNRALEAAMLRPVIDKVFDFGQAQGALAYLESAGHLGKIVVKV